MNTSQAQNQTRRMLRELGFSPRLIGYKALCVAIPHYARSDTLSVTKELYPSLRKRFGYRTSASIERPIRYAIMEAWEHRDAEVWKQYFPRQEKAPSNLQFIAELAEYLK